MSAKKKKLKCGHPGEPENLVNGKCGTCLLADDWQRAAGSWKDDAKMRKLCLKMAALCRVGVIIYDTRGATLNERFHAVK